MVYQPARFTEQSVRGLDANWKSLEGINAAVDRLSAERLTELHAEGPLEQSKIAWKFADLRQGLIYRMVDICEGAIASWESGNLLSALILGRASVETAAIIRTLFIDTERALLAEDLSALDKIAMRIMFGGKSTYWKIDPDLEARNVLSAIQRLEKTELPGILHHYESLSEIAHPNSQGQSQFYSETDQENRVVKFSRTKRLSNGLSRLTASLSSARWGEETLTELNALIPDIAALQHRIKPVGNDPSLRG